MGEHEVKKLSLLGHLKELRQRLLRCVIAVGVATVLAFVFSDRIFNILIQPAGGVPLIFIDPTEMFSTYMKVCLVSGVMLAMPYITHQFLMFVTPGLTAKERRAVYLILPWVTAMFAGGVIFAYFILLPPAMKFLFTFGSDIATPQIRIGNYITVVTRFMLAIGLVFELPVVTTFLARIGVITSNWLARRRKPAVIIAFVVAAIITPTVDPVNQSLVAVPLIVLYELSIWLAKLVQRRKAQAAATVPASSP